MKKVIGILIIAVLSSFNANAEVSIGISGNAGILDATGKETFNSGTTTKKEELGIAYISGFAEYHVPLEIGEGQFRIGASYVPYALESETNTNIRAAGEHGTDVVGNDLGASTPLLTQSIAVDIEDLTSYYVSYHYNMFFLKLGALQSKLITKENLGTGSQYPDGNLDGKFFGIGFDKDLNDGVFVRGELVQTDFDDIKLTSTGSDNVNVIDVTGLSGANLSISVGKTF
ncbi:hypothetical protein N8Z35_03485 [Pelagibacteraceae bacterium]|nr:hypothetical protein [Candidatus Pelagibacter bacterium]MDC1253983.1 hypothetical protein [Pelagibacteraceae bacterium]|tara:strand:- start:68 stop:754 length:687 start_codon:yes stop_codon:yes gene_type:complete